MAYLGCLGRTDHSCRPIPISPFSCIVYADMPGSGFRQRLPPLEYQGYIACDTCPVFSRPRPANQCRGWAFSDLRKGFSPYIP